MPTSTSPTASALTTFPVGPSNSMVYTGAGNYTGPPRHKTETITRTPLASQPTQEVTKTDLTSGTTVASILTTIKKSTTKTRIPFTKTSKGASSIQMTPTTKGAAFTTDSSYSKTKLTRSAFTGSVSPTNQPNLGTYPTASRQQFSQATSNSGSIFDTNKVHKSSTEDWKKY